jgi:hypothetical protein
MKNTGKNEVRNRRLPPREENAPMARDVVEDWLDRATESVQLWEELYEGYDEGGSFGDRGDSGIVAYDLVASWCGLERFPDGLDDEVVALRERLAEQIGRYADDLVRLIPGTSDPDGWLVELDEWIEEQETGEVPWEEIAERAYELFDDLDTAELVACGLERLAPSEGAALHEALMPCARRLTETPEAFLPAAAYARAMDEAFDPSLVERDPELLVTCLKYEVVLDELAEAWAVMESRGLGRLEPGLIEALAAGAAEIVDFSSELKKLFGDERSAAAFWNEAWSAPVVAAAAAVAESAPGGVWESRDKKIRVVVSDGWVVGSDGERGLRFHLYGAPTRARLYFRGERVPTRRIDEEMRRGWLSEDIVRGRENEKGCPTLALQTIGGCEVLLPE